MPYGVNIVMPGFVVIDEGSARGCPQITTVSYVMDASTGLCVDDPLNFEVQVRIRAAQPLGMEADA